MNPPILSAAMATALGRLADWPGEQSAQIEALGAGLNNLTVRVRFGNSDVVVRQVLPQGPAVKLSTREECEVLKAAAAAGVSPPLRHVDDTTGIVISQYLPNVRPWTPGDVNRPENLERLANRLQDLHALDLDIPAYRPLGTARLYQRGARELPSKLADELTALAGEFEAAYRPTVPCHNDLVAGNLLDDGRLWLIDFEYAARSDPMLDLAGAAALNGVPVAGRRRLLAAYYGVHQPDLGEFEGICRLVLLVALAWAHAMAQTQRTTPRMDYIRQLMGLLESLPTTPGAAS